MQKKYFLILLIFLLFAGVLLRLPNLNFPFFGDETWHEFAKYHRGGFFSVYYDSIAGKNTVLEDPPLNGWFYLAYTRIFGFSTVIMRSTSLLIGMVNIILVYFLAARIFNKKTAMLSIFLMIISYWHNFESYMIDRDGILLVLFSLLIICFYIQYRASRNQLWLLPGAVTAGICMFLKISGIFITAVLFLMILHDNKIFSELWANRKQFWKLRKYDLPKFKTAMFETGVFVMANILGYAVFSLGAYLLDPHYYGILFTQEIAPLEFLRAPFWQSIPREMIYLLLYGSPLLLGLTVLSLIKWNNKKFLFLSWLLVPILFYSKVPYAGALERYLSVIIPPLYILSASVLAEFPFKNKKYNILGLITGVLFFVLLNIFSLIRSDYLFHDVKEYMLRALMLKWNFLFPFYGAGGPAFLVPFWVLAVSIGLSMALLALALVFYKKKKHFYLFLVLFLAIAGAFNLYILQEFNFHIHTPNINKGYQETLAELQNEPHTVIYTNIGAIRIYSDKNIKFVYMRCPKKDTACWNRFDKAMKLFGGAAYILDFPRTFEKSERKKVIDANCNLRKEITDKQATIGYVYDCGQDARSLNSL